jgi:hypothetical protein
VIVRWLGLFDDAGVDEVIEIAVEVLFCLGTLDVSLRTIASPAF